MSKIPLRPSKNPDTLRGRFRGTRFTSQNVLESEARFRTSCRNDRRNGECSNVRGTVVSADEYAFAIGQVGAAEDFEILFAGRAERAREMRRVARRYGIPLAENTPLTEKLSEILNDTPAESGQATCRHRHLSGAAIRLK